MSRSRKTTPRKPDPLDRIRIIASLSDDVLKHWATSAVYGRGYGYQRAGNVLHIGRVGEGMIAAWVRGTRRYATFVEIDDDGVPMSLCTCPYGECCKHAVAAILELRALREQGAALAEVQEGDDRLAILERFDATDIADEWDEDLDDPDEDVDDDDDDDVRTGDGGRSAVAASSVVSNGAGAAEESHTGLPAWVADLEHSVLLDLLATACVRRPDLLRTLESLWRSQHDSPKRAVKALEREIHEVTSEPVWCDRWHDAGSQPDYSGIRAGLAALLSRGEADDVLRLGDLLLAKATEQLNESDDEGETWSEITDALEPVFAALNHCSLSPADRMLKAFEWEEEDEYSLCDGLGSFWSGPFDTRDWSDHADNLFKRLGNLPRMKDCNDSSTRRTRDSLVKRIVHALEHADRDEEAMDLCRSEALASGDHLRFIDALLARKRDEEAERWIRSGLEAAQGSGGLKERPLRNRLMELKRSKRDWPFVAALMLEELFDHPSVEGWNELKVVCTRAGQWPAVRLRALRFLETGIDTPDTAEAAAVLPSTGLPRRKRSPSSHSPCHSILLHIALAEKDIPEIMRLFAAASSRRVGHMFEAPLSFELLNDIARAVAHAHPDTSVAIWKRLAEQHIAFTQPSAYVPAVRYLRKCRDLLKSRGREAEWNSYFEQLLVKEKRKRSFMSLAAKLKE